MLLKDVARDISYAHSAQSKSGRAVIRVMENTTGRIGLIRRARGYDVDVAQGADFWALMCARYGLDLRIQGGSLENIPSEGPLIVVANHPYGILDGLMMGRMLSQRRIGDFRLLANDVFCNSPDLRDVVLPVRFDASKEAAKANLRTRTEALRYLGEGGAIGVFPGGTVSTAARPFAQALDPMWRNFTAKMIAKSGATVVPVFFDGTTSRLFQLASHVHSTLRMGLLIREFRSRVNSTVDVIVGDPIPAEALKPMQKDAKRMMDFLRKATYDLSPRPIDARLYGHEFEQRYRTRHGSGNF